LKTTANQSRWLHFHKPILFNFHTTVTDSVYLNIINQLSDGSNIRKIKEN